MEPSRDIALLRMIGVERASPTLTCPVSLEKPRIGAELALLGRSQAPGNLSISTGVISALQRNVGHSRQATAMMNYGNLGGPVIDRQGRLLGWPICSMKVRSWRQSCGVGFTIAATSLPRQWNHSRVNNLTDPTSFIGVELAGPSKELGAGVRGITANSPAALAGIEAGDRIIRFNQEVIENHLMLIAAIERAGIGNDIEMVVIHRRRRKNSRSVGRPP